MIANILDEDETINDDFASEPVGDESVDVAPAKIPRQRAPAKAVIPVSPPRPVSDGASNDLALRILKQVHESVGLVIRLLESGEEKNAAKQLADLLTSKKQFTQHLEDTSGSRVVEGIFDGEQMIGEDGSRYVVPPNYASKSRLVEGDRLKLTIGMDGRFLFKQILPVDRQRLNGTLVFDPELNVYHAMVGKKLYRLLTASVSFYHGEPENEVILLVPKAGESAWAAVENIIK